MKIGDKVTARNHGTTEYVVEKLMFPNGQPRAIVRPTIYPHNPVPARLNIRVSELKMKI